MQHSIDDTAITLGDLVTRNPAAARVLEGFGLDYYCCGGGRALAQACAERDVDPTEFPCGSLRNPISVMLAEHDRAGELLARLRRAAGGTFETPTDGCASYRALSSGLSDLEADTHLHIHKENNVLFPAVVRLEVDRTHEA